MNCLRYWWSITKEASFPLRAVEDIKIEGILPTWNTSSLLIPPHFLKYGFYRINYNMQILFNNYNVMRTSFTYTKIIKVCKLCLVIKV